MWVQAATSASGPATVQIQARPAAAAEAGSAAVPVAEKPAPSRDQVEGDGSGLRLAGRTGPGCTCIVM